MKIIVTLFPQLESFSNPSLYHEGEREREKARGEGTGVNPSEPGLQRKSYFCSNLCSFYSQRSCQAWVSFLLLKNILSIVSVLHSISLSLNLLTTLAAHSRPSSLIYLFLSWILLLPDQIFAQASMLHYITFLQKVISMRRKEQPRTSRSKVDIILICTEVSFTEYSFPFFVP